MRSGVRILWCVLWLGLLAGPAAAQTYPELMVNDDTIDDGIFDPSVEYLPDGSEGWLFYSTVTGGLMPWGPNVETQLAHTADHGASWTFVSKLNPVVPETIPTPGGPLPGIWTYEVASVAHDPNDPPAAWKMFVHRIFRPLDPNGIELLDSIPAYSWIAYRTAPDPDGPWSSEEALFSVGTTLPAPFSTTYDVNLLDPNQLGHLLVYSEPGAFVRDNVLYLSMTGLVATGSDQIVLLASTDHGATWSYVASPVTNPDMAAIGYVRLDGTAIVEQAGRVFLIGTPESPGLTHDGTLVLEFEDLTLGTLRRAPGGALQVIHHVPPQPALIAVGRGGGQADYHEHNSTGILMAQLEPASPTQVFHIFETGETPLSAQAVDALPPAGLALFALLILGAALAHGARQTNTLR